MYYVNGQIKDIQETDAGYYQCQVIIALNNKIQAEVDLQVRRPPVISDNSTRSAIVSEGQQVTLECYASGYPPPRISWRRENNAILPTGGSIYRYLHQTDKAPIPCKQFFFHGNGLVKMLPAIHAVGFGSLTYQ